MNSKFISSAIFTIMFLLNKTLRKKYLNPTERFPAQAIYPFWHGDEFCMLLCNSYNNITIMVSLSNDGQILSEILEKFGYNTVRGSSNKGGRRALIELIRKTRQGSSVAFASDGPKGPYHKLKEGPIYAAQKTGLPIVPISASAKNKIILKNSWEKGRIPLPFSKVVQIWDEPIYVSPTDDIAQKALFVEQKLNRLFEFTDKYYWQKDIAKYLQWHPCPKILIVAPSRLGDIIFALPAVSSIHRRYPHAKISWIVDERCKEILEGNPILSKIFVWNRKNRSFKYYRHLTKELRLQNFDLSIDFCGLAKSAFLVKLANAKFKLASSATNGMRELSWLISKQIKNPDPNAHCIYRHLAVAKYLKAPEIIDYPINIDAGAQAAVLDKLKNVDINKLILIHPGGGWLSRRWPCINFAQLASKISAELGYKLALVGGKEGGASEKGLNEEIIANSTADILDLTGKLTLKQLCAAFKICKLFIANEAGPAHIATALNTPTVAILGPTNALRTGPCGANTTIIQHKVSCQPCRRRNCKNPICIQSISVEEVFEQCLKKLGAK